MTSCEVVVEGEYVSEATMEEWGWSEPIDWIMYYYTSFEKFYFDVFAQMQLGHWNFIYLQLTLALLNHELFLQVMSQTRQRIAAVKKHCRTNPKKLLRLPTKVLDSLNHLNIDSTCPVNNAAVCQRQADLSHWVVNQSFPSLPSMSFSRMAGNKGSGETSDDPNMCINWLQPNYLLIVLITHVFLRHRDELHLQDRQ